MKHSVFTYGTLRLKSVRKDLLGYETVSSPALLKGFSMKTITLDNIEYPIISENPESDEIIEGEYFAVEEEDLKKLDRYESKAYRRIKVKLENQEIVWVYIQ
jgi:gamma-glutamylcyclotransferase (GGCT)/AIG2-like uncharacterized protein YtfP